MGDSMFYSSGTTASRRGSCARCGRVASRWFRAAPGREIDIEISSETVYLSPAPLYHAAPFVFVLTVQSFGGTAVIMEKFDAALALDLIERHRVTHSQWVPTMFVRMAQAASGYAKPVRSSSHRVAIHAAAPCPVDVKRK